MRALALAALLLLLALAPACAGKRGASSAAKPAGTPPAASAEIDRLMAALAGALLTALDDADGDVRWRAAMVLGGFAGAEVRAALERRLAMEKDANVRRHLQRSLAAVPSR
jgi:HEAT repeat protein